MLNAPSFVILCFPAWKTFFVLYFLIQIFFLSLLSLSEVVRWLCRFSSPFWIFISSSSFMHESWICALRDSRECVWRNKFKQQIHIQLQADWLNPARYFFIDLQYLIFNTDIISNVEKALPLLSQDVKTKNLRFTWFHKSSSRRTKTWLVDKFNQKQIQRRGQPCGSAM